jgi:hypothetical protein
MRRFGLKVEEEEVLLLGDAAAVEKKEERAAGADERDRALMREDIIIAGEREDWKSREISECQKMLKCVQEGLAR